MANVEVKGDLVDYQVLNVFTSGKPEPDKHYFNVTKSIHLVKRTTTEKIYYQVVLVSEVPNENATFSRDVSYTGINYLEVVDIYLLEIESLLLDRKDK